MSAEILIPGKTDISGVIDQFQTRAETFEQSAAWVTDQNLINSILGLIRIPKGSRCIELCCGTGKIGLALKNAGMKVIGVDISPAMLKKSEKRITVTPGNVEEMPFDSNTADLIVVRQALFLTDSGKVLEEVKRVLKPNGQFIVCNTVPISDRDCDYLKMIHQVKQNKLKIFYTSATLKLELTQHGFLIDGENFLTVDESIDRWMSPKYAPELSTSKREEVSDLIWNSPIEYRQTRKVRKINDQIFEKWGWMIYSARIIS
jgi:DNA gyrase subunit B